jgi:hypothetical protein
MWAVFLRENGLAATIIGLQSIQPLIQRIVWCYGQWQPAYEQISRTIPNVEFVRGISDDLEQDSYFDTSVNNLIVLNDLMTVAKNDNRVSDLFTKGSRHRCLSTIYVVQNLFAQGRASRDVSLNCQYMVLFNSPVDRHQISLLARRIYPKNSDKMMNKYEEAVSRPYGYLLIDFEPGTAESQRLKTDILSPQIGLNNMRNVIRGEAETLSRPSDLREPEVEPIQQPSKRKDIASQTVKLTKTWKLNTNKKVSCLTVKKIGLTATIADRCLRLYMIYKGT